MKTETAQKILEESKNSYNEIAQEFSNTRSAFWLNLTFLFSDLKPKERILDLGCGNGRLYQFLKEKSIEYIGLDNSSELIKIAKGKYSQANFMIGSALNLPFADNYFDHIYSIAVLHHIPSLAYRQQFLKEAKRVLKKEGRLVLTVWHLWQKKTVWFRLIKNTFLKIIHQSPLDFKDVYVPWGKSAKRYFHLFTQGELKSLVESVGFEVLKMGRVKKSKSNYNIYVIASNKYQ